MLRNVLSCVVESKQGRTLFAEVLVDDFRVDDLLFRLAPRSMCV